MRLYACFVYGETFGAAKPPIAVYALSSRYSRKMCPPVCAGYCDPGLLAGERDGVGGFGSVLPVTTDAFQCIV